MLQHYAMLKVLGILETVRVEHIVRSGPCENLWPASSCERPS